MAEISRNHVKTTIEETIGINCYEAVWSYIEDRTISLWGYEQPESFKEDSLMLCIYKDVVHIGYCKLAKAVKTWHPVVDKTLRHNTQKMRRYLGKWGRCLINIGNCEEWKNSARNLRRNEYTRDVNLWIDSTDFPLRGKRNPKGPNHSYKLDCQGVRFMAINDAKTRFVYVSSSYVPKLYDSYWIDIQKFFLQDHFSGAVIIGDCHFNNKTKVRGVKFICPTPNTVKPKGATAAETQFLTKKQKQRNKKVRAVRSRIEAPFGNLKLKFKSLALKFGEDIEQLEYRVFFAAGVHNYCKK